MLVSYSNVLNLKSHLINLSTTIKNTMKLRFLFNNPFYLSALSFIVVLMIYSLGWSTLYPRLSLSVMLFLLVLFSYYISLGTLFNRYLTPVRLNSEKGIPRAMFVFFYLSWFLVFLYNGSFPLVELIKNPLGEELDLIPSFYVLVYSFTCFFSVFLYQNYRMTGSSIVLSHFIISLLPFILMVSRIGTMTTLLSVLFVHLYTLKRLKKRTVLLVLTFVFTILYLFGVLGNIRSQVFADNTLAQETKATSSFLASPIPKEYYWTYIYGASPLANFQNIINKTEVQIEEFDYTNFLIYYGFPDVVTNRLESRFNISKPYPENKFIMDFLNVCTIYTNAYINLGWLGPYLVLASYSFFLIIYIFALNRESEYYLTGLCSISTIFFFGIFDNILMFSAVSFQLFFPLLFGHLLKTGDNELINDVT